MSHVGAFSTGPVYEVTLAYGEAFALRMQSTWERHISLPRHSQHTKSVFFGNAEIKASHYIQARSLFGTYKWHHGQS